MAQSSCSNQLNADQVSNSGASSGRWSYKFRIRSTFIDVADERDSSLSPRASSDPGSVTSFSDRHSSVQYEQYANELSGTMSQIWGQQSSERSRSQSFSTLPDKECLGFHAAMPDPHELHLGAGRDVDVHGAAVMDALPSLPASAIHKDGRLDGVELRSHIKYAAREVEKSLHQKRRRAVLSAIQEIPDQVGDALQKSAMGIIDDVIGEVAVVKDMIEGDEEQTEQSGVHTAVAKLEVIPEMIQDSLEAYFSKAERTVRAHVDDMIQNLEASDLANEQVVKKVWAIPSEVQEIAKQAMQAAVVESRVQAQLQIDCALASLDNHGAKRLAGVAELRIMPQVPTDSTEIVEGARGAVVDTVERVVAVVKKEDDDIPVVTNQVVAETLLRAKVESTSEAGRDKPSLFVSDVNEGSIGHPELCARPCLYFAKGECANGICCNFCHLDHPRRPVHPDKKNRQLLKEMPFPECVAVLTPILREKVEELCLGKAVLRELDAFALDLAGAVGNDESLELSDQSLGGRRKKQLQEFLRSMTLRSVMALLMRAAPSAEQREAVEQLTVRLRLASHPGGRPSILC